jgi:Domain of unknown function (DUF4279)
MKKPRPQPPEDAQAGTTWFGGPIPWFSIAIEITGDDLEPDEITSLLGVSPTQQQAKGKLVSNPNGRRSRMGRFGRWSLQLQPSETDEWDVAEATKLLISKVPADHGVWKSISSRARVRLNVGLSLETFNQGLSIDPILLRLLADREMQLDIGIYAGDDLQPAGKSETAD